MRKSSTLCALCVALKRNIESRGYRVRLRVTCPDCVGFTVEQLEGPGATGHA